MISGNLERMEYLTEKARIGVISDAERNELAQLVGHDPQEFQGPDGLSVLLAIALIILIGAFLIGLIKGE